MHATSDRSHQHRSQLSHIVSLFHARWNNIAIRSPVMIRNLELGLPPINRGRVIGRDTDGGLNSYQRRGVDSLNPTGLLSHHTGAASVSQWSISTKSNKVYKYQNNIKAC